MAKVPPKQQRSGNWVLAAMIFAVGMTFIDQTIVSIAIPDIEQDLQLSETGIQWIVNAYLLALSATFALGGRLADTMGSRRMVTIGVITFAISSALCGLTPNDSFAEAWIVFFRALQGVGAAMMIPAALALVIGSFEVRKRGQALAIFFGVTGALTSIGPIAGGYLTTIDWRAIFWINVPIAIIALVLIAYSKPTDKRNPAPLDVPGAVLVTGGMAFSVLGLQQSSVWGWSSWMTIGSIVHWVWNLIRSIACRSVGSDRATDSRVPLRRSAITRVSTASLGSIRSSGSELGSIAEMSSSGWP
jgi:MFS family permease